MLNALKHHLDKFNRIALSISKHSEPSSLSIASHLPASSTGPSSPKNPGSEPPVPIKMAGCRPPARKHLSGKFQPHPLFHWHGFRVSGTARARRLTGSSSSGNDARSAAFLSVWRVASSFATRRDSGVLREFSSLRRTYALRDFWIGESG